MKQGFTFSVMETYGLNYYFIVKYTMLPYIESDSWSISVSTQVIMNSPKFQAEIFHITCGQIFLLKMSGIELLPAKQMLYH